MTPESQLMGLSISFLGFSITWSPPSFLIVLFIAFLSHPFQDSAISLGYPVLFQVSAWHFQSHHTTQN